MRPYRTKTDAGREIFSDSHLRECVSCGLVQAVPRPSLQELSDYYAVDYRAAYCAGEDVADVEAFPKDNLFYYNRGQSIAELLSPHIDGEAPEILDVGAGYGHTLAALGERYPDSERTAIEFSDVCVRHLRSLGVEVHDEPAEDVLPRIERSFDVVVVSHVLEHLLNPREILELLRSHLRPGGVLYIEVPNIPRETIGRFPDHVWAPRFDEPHVSFFSADVLRGMLASADLEVEFCETAGPRYRYISGWRYRMPTMRWLVQGLIPRPIFHFLRRSSFTRAVRVREREDAFYEYGGLRLWIRAVSRRMAGSPTTPAP